MGKTNHKKSTTFAPSSSSSSSTAIAPTATSTSSTTTLELSDLGSLAQEMEAQLMSEFETLLAARKSTTAATTTHTAAASTGNKEQEARDAIYWQHMYERLRDLRETEAERLLREATHHAEEREKSLMDLIEHLEATHVTGGGGKGGSKKGLKDIRLSDVSVMGNAAAAMEEDEEEEAHTSRKKSSRSSTDKELAAAEARIETLESKLAELKRVLMAYQRFSSLCITLEKPPSSRAATPAERMSKLSCTAINHVHKKAVKFSLKMNVDVEDNLGLDATFKPVANKELFPYFLQQEATLETKQCPLLLLSILKTLFDEKRTGGGKSE